MRSGGVTLLVDAEQTYLQPAIDACVQVLQEYFNVSGQAVVLNTVQSYLTDSRSRLNVSLAMSRARGYTCGIKLVRGAYIVSELALAESSKYKRPIHVDIEYTHANFNACAALLIASSKAGGVKVRMLQSQDLRSLCDYPP